MCGTLATNITGGGGISAVSLPPPAACACDSPASSTAFNPLDDLLTSSGSNITNWSGSVRGGEGNSVVISPSATTTVVAVGPRRLQHTPVSTALPSLFDIAETPKKLTADEGQEGLPTPKGSVHSDESAELMRSNTSTSSLEESNQVGIDPLFFKILQVAHRAQDEDKDQPASSLPSMMASSHSGSVASKYDVGSQSSGIGLSDSGKLLARSIGEATVSPNSRGPVGEDFGGGGYRKPVQAPLVNNFVTVPQLPTTSSATAAAGDTASLAKDSTGNKFCCLRTRTYESQQDRVDERTGEKYVTSEIRIEELASGVRQFQSVLSLPVVSRGGGGASASHTGGSPCKTGSYSSRGAYAVAGRPSRSPLGHTSPVLSEPHSFHSSSAATSPTHGLIVTNTSTNLVFPVVAQNPLADCCVSPPTAASRFRPRSPAPASSTSPTRHSAHNAVRVLRLGELRPVQVQVLPAEGAVPATAAASMPMPVSTSLCASPPPAISRAATTPLSVALEDVPQQQQQPTALPVGGGLSIASPEDAPLPMFEFPLAAGSSSLDGAAALASTPAPVDCPSSLSELGGSFNWSLSTSGRFQVGNVGIPLVYANPGGNSGTTGSSPVSMRLGSSPGGMRFGGSNTSIDRVPVALGKPVSLLSVSARATPMLASPAGRGNVTLSPSCSVNVVLPTATAAVGSGAPTVHHGRACSVTPLDPPQEGEG